jgi:hypothetical protein
MSVVSLLGVRVLNNPAPFTAQYEFEITFECLEPLKQGKEVFLVLFSFLSSPSFLPHSFSFSLPIPHVETKAFLSGESTHERVKEVVWLRVSKSGFGPWHSTVPINDQRILSFWGWRGWKNGSRMRSFFFRLD